MRAVYSKLENGIISSAVVRRWRGKPRYLAVGVYRNVIRRTGSHMAAHRQLKRQILRRKRMEILNVEKITKHDCFHKYSKPWVSHTRMSRIGKSPIQTLGPFDA